MVRPRGKVIYQGKTPGMKYAHQIDSVEIAAWCPDEKAMQPPEQVHMVFKITGLEDMPIVLRYKSPDTLGFLIEELERYRRYVWPNAESLDLEKK
jgi:hypothetical protein